MVKAFPQSASMKMYVLLEKGNKIFMMRRKGTGFMDGFYNPPAGRVDGEEDFVQAAIREAKEESGVSIDSKNIELVHTAHRKGTGKYEGTFWIDFFFKCTKWKNDPHIAEPEKSDDPVWLNYDHDTFSSGNEIDNYFTNVFSKIKRGEAFSTFGWSGEERILVLKEAV